MIGLNEIIRSRWKYERYLQVKKKEKKNLLVDVNLSKDRLMVRKFDEEKDKFGHRQ
jgi:hypothetical protein